MYIWCKQKQNKMNNFINWVIYVIVVLSYTMLVAPILTVLILLSKYGSWIETNMSIISKKVKDL